MRPDLAAASISLKDLQEARISTARQLQRELSSRRSLVDRTSQSGAVSWQGDFVTNRKAGLRADAARHRKQILAAATEAFTHGNLDLPMAKVARAAGIGVGTLYRRFADREALVLAVIEDSLIAVLAQTRAAAEEPDAWDGLARSMTSTPELTLVLQLLDQVSDVSSERIQQWGASARSWSKSSTSSSAPPTTRVHYAPTSTQVTFSTYSPS